MAESIFSQIEVAETQTQASSKVIKYGTELAFDFQQNEFIMQDGKPKVVEGVEALKVWIEKAIRTSRYCWPVYTFAYGCELEEIIGLDLPRAVLESELKRTIREALIYDERIEDIRDFVIERDEDRLNVEFTVVTFDGRSLDQEVSTVV